MNKVDLSNNETWMSLLKAVRSDLRNRKVRIPDFLDQEIEQRSLL